MINNQRHLFTIPEDVHYFNCAYMSPLLNSAAKAGCESVNSKAHPRDISASGFFSNDSEYQRAYKTDFEFYASETQVEIFIGINKVLQNG